MPAGRRFWGFPTPFATAVIACLAICTLNQVAAHSGDITRYPGRWSAGENWGDIPIHLNVLRGVNGWHTQILWWQAHSEPGEANPGFHGGLMGWNAVDTLACFQAGTALVPIDSITREPDSNIFCAGQTQLDDGRLLVLGGTERHSPENGGAFNRIFDPIEREWVLVPDMQERRWYATGTTLPTGNVLVSSGSQYQHMYMFGGVRPNGSYASDSLQRFAFAGTGQWDDAVLDANVYSPGPVSREGATLTKSPLLLFGGKKDTTFYKTVWDIERYEDPGDFLSDYPYFWTEYPAATVGPPERADHSAFILPDATTTSAYTVYDGLVVYGGYQKSAAVDTVYDDVWRGVRNFGTTTFTWTKVTIESGAPGPRLATRWQHSSEPPAPTPCISCGAV